MIWLQQMSCLSQNDAWVTLFCHVKGTLVIFRIWLINQPHFLLLPKGERVAVILVTAHTAPYVRPWTLAKLGENAKQNFHSLSLPPQAWDLSGTVFVFSLVIFLKASSRNQSMWKGLTYMFTVVLKGFSGLCIVDPQLLLGTEILRLSNSV